MKKRVGCIILLISSLTIFLSGCAKTKTIDNISEEDKYSWKNTMDIKKVSFDIDEDCQPYWNGRATHRYAKADTGYYYMDSRTGNDGILLQNFNPESEEYVVLCDRIQCNHDVEECPAFFKETEYLHMIWRYKDNLYAIKCDSEENAVLVQLDLDGKNRKELFEIGKIMTSQDRPCNMYNLTFCDDDVYIYRSAGNCAFTTGKNMEINVRRRSLDGKEDEIIMKSSEDYCIFDSVKAYGGKIFFVYTHYVTEDYSFTTKVSAEGLFYYDPNTKEAGRIMDKEIIDYSIDEENKIIYYYVIGEGLYKYELNTGNEALIFKKDELSSMCQITYDGGYIFMDNGKWAFGNKEKQRTWILDKDGKELKKLSGFGNISYLGDKDCIFTEGSKEILPYDDITESWEKYFTNSDIESDATEWKSAKWN